MEIIENEKVQLENGNNTKKNKKGDNSPITIQMEMKIQLENANENSI